MKYLLTTTTVFEAATGVALAIDPALVVAILLGDRLTEPSAFLLGRLAGSALITIALACWLSRNNSHSVILVKAMVAYNIFSTILLVYARFQGFSGPGLWPAAILHVVLLVWCLTALKQSAQSAA